MDSLRMFVKKKRKELKLTQEDLADNAGVGLRFVRDLEQGKKDVTFRQRKRHIGVIR